MQTRVITALRSAAVAGAVGAVLLAGQPAGAARPASGRVESSAARAAALRVGTFNIDAGLPLDRWRQAVEDFIPRVDIAGLQEAAGTAKAAALRSMPGIGSYVSPHFLQEPIFWNSSLFSLVRGRSPKIADGRAVEGRGGGTVHQKPTLATVARLRSKTTGRTISVIDVHLLQGAVHAGKRVHGAPRRFAMYEDQVRNLGKVVAKEKKWADGRVWLLGDFNDNYVADKKKHKRKLAYATMHRRGLVASWEAVKGKLRPGQGSGSRSGAYLDVVWSPHGASSVAVLREEAFRVGQHYPLVSTYRMP